MQVQAVDIARLAPLIGPERMSRVEHVADAVQTALSGRAVININSTAAGGGVAEMLVSLLAYVRGVGIDARWLVIQGDDAFFQITKRIHNGLYGGPGDGGPLGDSERSHYERVLHENANELLALVRRGDVIMLHDPQPAGLAAVLAGAGARVIWRCHVGCDAPTSGPAAPGTSFVRTSMGSRASWSPARRSRLPGRNRTTSRSSPPRSTPSRRRTSRCRAAPSA